MLITPDSLKILYTAFSAKFNQGFKAARSYAADVAMETNSASSEEQYPWLGQWAPIREWVGDRVVSSLELYTWPISNRKFESTVGISREKIEDDQYGVLGPMFEQLGRKTRQHPDTLLFNLLKSGFTAPCYDGQPFFSAAHPARDENDNDIVYSNLQAGAAAPWFLLDTSQAVRPLVWQKRTPYEFQQVTNPGDQHVFRRDEYLYGVRARVNAGFGLWQLAFGSQAPLTSDNFAAAVASMKSLRGDRGDILGINPTALVVGPALEKDARTLLKATSVADIVTVGGVSQAIPATNIWHESAELIVTPFLA